MVPVHERFAGLRAAAANNNNNNNNNNGEHLEWTVLPDRKAVMPILKPDL